MAVYKETIEGIQSKGVSPTYVDITAEVREIIKKSGIKNGICSVISPHTTCSVFFEEYVHDRMPNGKEFIFQDLDNCLEKIIPNQTAWGQYFYPGLKHFEDVESWPDIKKYLPSGTREELFNADAHLKATLIGNSSTFEVDNGELGVGKTGYVYFVDFDRTHARTRKCKVVVIGE
ncbi:MAG: YjbQ family protein [Erysipelotrichaceae bacterium]|nr:YjbQ family protein [Erysipelotrichaceae bacterium]MBQ1534105.1 YjbQ family protein [Erysipelotrichaceae bacterium]MBQ1787708.1 YjbQ family protein [Erysipelotrichaceae bacterium]MBQ5804832.1 YjbQ family protein [Erysipelotrichaceae bacterium]